MNVVVFYNWLGVINGALIDAFEYFMAIHQHAPVKLILINCNKNQLNKFIKVFENRYYLDNEENWKNDIILLERPYKLIKQEFNKALVVDYSTIYKTKGLLRSKNIYVISDLHTDNPDFMYDKKLQRVWYFGEMPFVYKDQQYKGKMLLEWMRKPKKVKEGLYINVPSSDDFSILDEMVLPDKPKIFKSGIHLENMFEHFDTYVYAHANKWFDPHPRLFHECAYMDKKIIYYNPNMVKDGSYYRIIDLVDNNDLNERFLDENDEVVQKFI